MRTGQGELERAREFRRSLHRRGHVRNETIDDADAHHLQASAVPAHQPVSLASLVGRVTERTTSRPAGAPRIVCVNSGVSPHIQFHACGRKRTVERRQGLVMWGAGRARTSSSAAAASTAGWLSIRSCPIVYT